MAVATTSTVSNTSGLAENFSDIVWDVSPTETPYLTMAKRQNVTARVYQWQEDALDTVSANYYQEGDDASFVTSSQTTSLSSPMQISRKTVNISTVLAGQRLGLKAVDDGIWIVSVMRYDLGFIDLEQRTLQPLDNPFGPGLSPMS